MSASGPENGTVVDRQTVVQSYLDNRRRTRALFDLLDNDAYYERPIPLRHPVVFYEGHIPAFSVNCFLKKGLDHPGLDAGLEVLFARGIDPSDQQSADERTVTAWPAREEVERYASGADRAILAILESGTVEGEGNPVLHRGQGVFTMLEHEVMHQETLLYMWHRFEPERKRRPDSARPLVDGAVPAREMVRVPAGRATLGADVAEILFGWDNESPKYVVDVVGFEIDRHDVTNQDYLAFVQAGGYENPEFWTPAGWARRQADGLEHPLFWERRDGLWLWRGMFERLPLPPSWPVYVSHAEASAYARWAGMRLPTEPEFHRAAYGTPEGPERPHPWGDGQVDETRGNFDFRHWDPVPVGSHPAGASAWGVQDLVGNGFEWTSTPFAGYPGFQVMASYPEYSADFFDGDHFVCKGASPATGRDLVRRSFRNWFRPHYPYMYATFRCAR
jgi:iron(II)-dependent oxidoreductase